ncbi:MAG: ABC transporter permease [Ignavibacteriales bacterium]|nr:MAG: ABC transporter permease [Ignavibacteriales bacterium]
MFKNYLKIAFRNLLKNKIHSAINIAGLIIGITCVVLIFLFVSDELSYDRFHSKKDRIYRVIEKIDTEGQGEESSSNPFPVGPTLYNDYPHLIEAYVRFFNFQAPSLTLQVGDKKINEKKIYFADSTLFKVFDFPLAQGNPSTALASPNSIILTKELARKYFGDSDPLNQTMLFEGQFSLKVTGVFDELPSQSHFNFECLISFTTVYNIYGQGINNNWVWNPNWTYVLLKENIDPKELEAQFPEFIQKYYPAFIKPQITHYLQPLTDIHLKSDLDYEMQPNGDEADIYIFGIIGFLILFIACINFMNLATAKSVNRAREVGMRKVLGANRIQLIKQFLGESVLMSLIAVCVSILFIEILLPLFNSLSGKDLSAAFWSEPMIVAGLIIFGVIVGLIAGIYPAFFLSSAEPATVLKGTKKLGMKSEFFRKGLVIIQFTISLGLIISTMIIYDQLNFLRNADLGFDKSQVIVMPTRPPIIPKAESFKEEVLRNHNIRNFTVMNEIIGEHHNTHEFNYEGMEAGKWIYFPALMVDEKFVETFDIKIIAGRNFSKEIITDDSLGLLINESMVRHLGWGSPDEAIGKQFYTPLGQERVIGVFRDFNFVSLVEPIGPFVLDMPAKPFIGFFKKFFAVKVSTNEINSTLSYLEKTWSSYFPEYPFEYSFLNDNLDYLYKSQDNLGSLIGYFSLLAIIIACLGLFALASFTAEKRTKEIGIRKVLGASVTGIVGLLSKEFLILVILANLIAWPVTYFVMNNWLESFAYRTSIDVFTFITAGLIATLIALLTVSYQSIKSALANPVESLRSE